MPNTTSLNEYVIHINKKINTSVNFDQLTLNPDPVENDQMSFTVRVLIAIICLIVILLSLMGNALVITVILRFKRLKNATNYILLSLAIADLTVSLLVMLPAMIQDVIQKWIFSHLFCKFYNAFDITCCTASILHLLLVAIDRYIAIFKPLTYRNMVRKWHVFVMVIFVWALSLSMSFIPIFMGWNQSSKTNETVSGGSESEMTCALEANVAYAVISSSLSFYIPLVIMAVVYLQIYIVARRQAEAIFNIELHSKKFSQDTETNLNSNNNEHGNDLLNEKQMNKLNKILKENGEMRNSDDKTDKKGRILKMIKSLKNIERKRTKDTKAIKTLGIIMGIFILCWLPFFMMYLYAPIMQKPIPIFVERLITWIGYINSFINPIVYALTNRDFRKSYIATLRQIVKKTCPRKFLHNTKKLNFSDKLNVNSKNSKNKKNSIFCRCCSCCTGVNSVEVNSSFQSQNEYTKLNMSNQTNNQSTRLSTVTTKRILSKNEEEVILNNDKNMNLNREESENVLSVEKRLDLKDLEVSSINEDDEEHSKNLDNESKNEELNLNDNFRIKRFFSLKLPKKPSKHLQLIRHKNGSLKHELNHFNLEEQIENRILYRL